MRPRSRTRSRSRTAATPTPQQQPARDNNTSRRKNSKHRGGFAPRNMRDAAATSTADFMLRTTASCPAPLVVLLSTTLEEAGLQVSIVQDDDRRSVLTVTASSALLELTAETTRLEKRTVEDEMDYFTVSGRSLFQDINSPEHFFSPSERAMLVLSALQFLTVDGAELRRAAASAPSLANILKERRATGHGRGAGAADKGELPLVRLLEQGGCLDVVAPVHERDARLTIFNETVLFSPFLAPVEKIRDYYGCETAYYFAWMDFTTTWFCVPACIGLGSALLRTLRGATIDDSAFTPLFSVFMFAWAVAYLRCWERREAELAWAWGTYDHDAGEEMRPGFEGTYRTSPVTGKPERFFSDAQRAPRYLLSTLVTVLMLAIAAAVQVASLNFQGYINPAHDRARWPTDDDHPFHVAALADLAVPGAVFDPNTNMGLIPVVAHVLVIMVLNMVYSRVAEQLNEWENHRTVQAEQNSLIIKRFGFEAFDAFVGMLYLAFYEFDVVKLRGELVAVYTTDSIRRVVVECVLPLAMHWFATRNKINPALAAAAAAAAAAKHNDEPNAAASGRATLTSGTVGSKLRRRDSVKARLLAVDAQAHRVEMEADLDPVEPFDDWLEMVIQFGYVSLFASAFPLAAALSILCNVIEVRSDCFKLTFVHRRPRAHRANKVGGWSTVLKVMIWASALTNCALIGFSSMQLMQWFPSLFKIAADGDQEMASGEGRYVVLIVFLLEHALWLVGIAITAMIDPVPEVVRVALARREYAQQEALRKIRAEKNRELLEETSGGGAAVGE